jgi:hypothetical protein
MKMRLRAKRILSAAYFPLYLRPEIERKLVNLFTAIPAKSRYLAPDTSPGLRAASDQPGLKAKSYRTNPS